MPAAIQHARHRAAKAIEPPQSLSLPSDDDDARGTHGTLRRHTKHTSTLVTCHTAAATMSRTLQHAYSSGAAPPCSAGAKWSATSTKSLKSLAERGHEAGSGWLHTLSSASSFCNAAFSAFTDSNSDFKCSTSSALEAFRYCLMKLWQRNGRR